MRVNSWYVHWIVRNIWWIWQTRWFQYFHITNFPFLSINIPSSPVYGVFISQLIRYTGACSSYECFILRARRLSSKLFKQGYLVERLKSLFRKFYGRYGDLIQKYEISSHECWMTFWPLTSYSDFPNRSYFPPISWPWYRTWTSPNYEWFPRSISNGCGKPAGLQVVELRPLRIFLKKSSPESLHGFWWNSEGMEFLWPAIVVIVFSIRCDQGCIQGGTK